MNSRPVGTIDVSSEVIFRSLGKCTSMDSEIPGSNEAPLSQTLAVMSGHSCFVRILYWKAPRILTLDATEAATVL